MDCKNKDNFIECDNLNEYLDYENDLYNNFNGLYNNADLFYMEQPVKMKHYPPEYDIKSGFYHLIYENYDDNKTEENRVPNLERCKRLHWIRVIIEECSVAPCKNLLVWKNKRNGKINVLLYCIDLDYLVVLSERKNYYLLTTAYPVNTSHRRDSLQKEYNRYKQITHST